MKDGTIGTDTRWMETILGPHNQALHSIDDDNHECCAVNCTGTVNKYMYMYKFNVFLHGISVSNFQS